MAMQFSKEDWEKLKKDSAEIYQKREDGLGSEGAAGLSKQERRQHFKEYYLKGCIALVLVIIIAVVGIKKVTEKTAHCALYIAMKDDVIPEEQLLQFEQEVGDYLGFDPEEKFVMIDTACTDQELEMYFYAGTADILVADEKTFEKWGQAGYFYAAGRDDEAEFYQEYDDQYQYLVQYTGDGNDSGGMSDGAQGEEPDGQAKYNCGMYLTDSGRYRQLGGSMEKPVIGISVTTRRLPQAEAFVRYMLEE